MTPLIPLDAMTPEMTILAAATCSAILLLAGGLGVWALRDRSVARMRALGAQVAGPVLTRTATDDAPRGLLRGLIPDDAPERAQIRFQLARVGFGHDTAVRDFFVLRLALALVGPVAAGLALALGAVTPMQAMQAAAILAAAGFYGPGYWLNGRIAARQLRIRQGFPNALDLMQISVEAGLGFDAALARVGQELGRASPDIAWEFLTLQHEIAAGRDRERAMTDMADRMGIDEAASFVLVIAQSMQFGTSLTGALRTYATEMRTNRDLAAQEKANKLPVQMSAVMSVLMLPALFLITLTPTVIRYMAMY